MELKRQLQSARRQDTSSNKNIASDAKGMAANATPSGFFSLISQANLASDWMYGLAIFAAMFKDFIDPIQFTTFLYILVFALTTFAAIFIFFMTLLGSLSEGGRGSRKKGKQNAIMMKQGLALLGGTAAELLPGIDLLPIETLTVLFIYATVLSARKQRKEEEKMNKNTIPQGSNNNRQNIPRWAAADSYSARRAA